MFGDLPIIHFHFKLAAVVTYCLQSYWWYTKLVPSRLLKQDGSTNYLHYWSNVTLLQAQRSRVDGGTDQAEGDAYKLEYISVRDAVHAAHDSVSCSERGTHKDTDSDVELQDHHQGRTCRHTGNISSKI